MRLASNRPHSCPLRVDKRSGTRKLLDDCRPHRLARSRTSDFRSDNGGSNPPGVTASRRSALDATEVWRSLFENWPETIPREGLLVTTFNEHLPFNGFLVSGGVLLIDRDKPDTYGARKVMVAYSAILAVKITAVMELGRFQVMGFQPPF